jgi:class 3 adenylate cyclase/tetratricopeptide (TPR) repeat protein
MKCPKCSSEMPSAAKFCSECGGAMSAGVKREVTAFRSAIGERRVLTVLFADMKGFTALAEAADPEEVHRLVDGLFARFAEVIVRYGGKVDKYIGDAVLAIFGVPEAHEDDAVRAIHCAREIQCVLRAIPRGQDRPPLQMRMGINTGECFWGSVGGGAPTVMGDAVNVAQRLEGLALPGHILVSLSTKKLAEDHFTFQMMPATEVKGRVEFVQPYEVIAVRSIDTEFRKVSGIHAPMVGREREMSALKDAFLEVAETGEPRLVLLVGEAGVGKSRLIHEFHAWVGETHGSVRTGRGRCVPYGASSFWPFTEILRTRYGLAPGADAESQFISGVSKDLALLSRLSGTERENAAHLLGMGLLGLRCEGSRVKGLEAREFAAALSVAFRNWIAAIAIRGPVVMTLEDIHWADAATLDLVEDTMGLLGDIPFLLLCAMRPEGNAASRAFARPVASRVEAGDLRTDVLQKRSSLIVLKTLAVEATRELICRVLGEPGGGGTPRRSVSAWESRAAGGPNAELEGFVSSRCGGNPYYIEELLRYLIENGFVRSSEERGVRVWSLSGSAPLNSVPATLDGLLGARIDGLGESARQVVSAASVVGREFWPGLVEAIIGREVGADLHFLSDVEIVLPSSLTDIHGEQEYMFKHALLKDAAYARIPKARRGELHRLAADWIAARGRKSGNAKLLALEAGHRELSGDDRRAVGVWLKVAEEVSDTSLSEGEAACTRALGILDRMREAGAYLAELDEPLRVDLLRWRGSAMVGLGSLDAAKADLVEVLRCVQSDADAADASKRIGDIEDARGRMPEAMDRYNRALDLVRGSGLLEEASVLLALARFARRTGCGLSDVEPQIKRAQEIACAIRDSSPEDDPRHTRAIELFGLSKAGLGHVRWWEGRLAEAETLVSEAMAIYESIDDKVGLGAVLDLMGLVRHDMGRLDKALESYTRHLEMLEARGNRYGILATLCNLGNVHMDLGEFDKAVEFFLRALSAAEETGCFHDVAGTLCSVAAAYLQKGDHGMAAELARKALAVKGDGGLYSAARCEALEVMVDVCQREERWKEAEDLASQALDHAVRSGIPPCETEACVVLCDLALCRKDQEAGRRVAKAREWLGRALAAAGRSESVRRTHMLDIISLKVLVAEGSRIEALELAKRLSADCPYWQNAIECRKAREALKLARDAGLL